MKRLYLTATAISVATVMLVGCTKQEGQDVSSSHANGRDASKIWPKLDIAVKTDPTVEAKIDALMTDMTLEQKIAQMMQPEIRDITVEDMRKYGFGSYLNGGGSFPQQNKHSTPQDWIKLAEDMYQASIDPSMDGSTIPTMWGTDAVHGHNNVIGATLFPHNIGLGAANNPDLIEKIAAITATEVMVTGIDWVFAPTVATVRDDRWGRTYEGYSEDPEIVRSYASAIVKGLQGHADKDFLSDDRVISTVKHFVGDGGTVKGDDQGDNIASEQELFDIHAQGYVGGLTAGAQSVMASFNSWHGDKIHGNKYLLTDVLKEQMGFDGFVVGDWNGHGQVKGCSNESCPQAINAGLDIFMVPTDAWKPLYENTIAQVKDGTIAMSRIDDAVRRILRVKVRAGLFEKPSPANRQFSGKTELIGQQSHRDVARASVRESLVLLKNKNNVLPLAPDMKVLVAGDGADNIGKQSGGWTITWQGTNNSNDEFPGGTSIYDGIVEQVSKAGGQAELSESGDYKTKPDVAVVVFGEEPYAEGHGDRENLDYQRGEKSDLALLQKLKADGIPVVSIFISGRPMFVNAELNASDAFVAAWLPGSEGNGVAEVLFKDSAGAVQYDFTGKLSFSWPKSPEQTTVNRGDSDYDPLLPYGFGLTYGDKNVLADDLDETVEFDASKVATRHIFNGSMVKPWVMYLYSGKDMAAVTSNTAKLPNIHYRTIDRVVQEDSLLLDYQGGEAGIRIASKSHFREDVRSDLDAKSALQFSYRVDQKPAGEVSLFMNCEGTGDEPGSCFAKVDVTELFANAEIGQWQTASVDLACFAQGGMKMGDLVIPFELASSDKFTVGLADIAFEPNLASQATISCQ